MFGEEEVSLRYVAANGEPAVVLTDPALASMTRFQQTGELDREAGGQLFAIFEGSDTLIVEASPPKLFDRRTRHRFRPIRILQRREIRDRHKTRLALCRRLAHSSRANSPPVSRGSKKHERVFQQIGA